MQCNLVPFSAVGSLALSCPCRSSGLGPPSAGNRNCRPRERKLITHAEAEEQQNLQKRKLRKSGDIIGEGNEKSGKKKKKREREEKRREEKRREEKTEERTKIPGSAEA